MFQWDLISERYIHEIFSFPISKYEFYVHDRNIPPLVDQYFEIFQSASKSIHVSPSYIHDHFESLISTFSYLLDFSSSIIKDFTDALLQSGILLHEQISWMIDNMKIIVFTDKQISIVSSTLKKIIYIISEIIRRAFRSSLPSHCPEKFILDSDIENFACYFRLVNRLLLTEIEFLFCSPTDGSLSDTIMYLMLPSFLIIHLPKLLKKFSLAFIQSICSYLNKYPCLLVETGLQISESLLSLQPKFHLQHLQPDILLLLEEIIPRFPYLGLQLVRELILKLQPNNNVSIVRILGPVFSIVAGKCEFRVEELLHLIFPLLDADCYLVRNLGLSTLTDILGLKFPRNLRSINFSVVSGKSYSDLKYDIFDKLSDHVIDINAFVRTRCISLITSLWESDLIPLNKQFYFLEMLVERIFDTSVLVRKQTFFALTSIIQNNPFKSEVLNFQTFHLTLEKELSILQSVIANVYDRFFQLETIDTVLHADIEDFLQSNHEISIINCDPQEEYCLYDRLILEINIGYVGDCIAAFDWLKRYKPKHYVFQNPVVDITPVILSLSYPDLLILSSMIRINKGLEFFKQGSIQRGLQVQKINLLNSAIEFIEIINRCLPNALMILQSNLSSDVLSSMLFLTEYIKYKLPDYLTCINPIMSLIWSHHLAHREYAIRIFIEYLGLSFNTEHSIISQYTPMIQAVSDIIYSHISYMEYYSIERTLSSLAQQGKFPSDFFSVLLLFSTQSSDSVCSNFLSNVMMITCMIAKESDVILLGDYQLIVSTCFTKNLMNLQVARLGCIALNIMCTRQYLSTIQFPRLKISHPIFKSIGLFFSSKLCDLDIDWSNFMCESLVLTLKLSRTPLLFFKNCISSCTTIINIIVDERRKIIGISRVFMLIGRVAQLFILMMEGKISDPIYESFSSSSNIPTDYVSEHNHVNFDQLYSFFASGPDIFNNEIRSKSIFSRYTYLLTHILQSSIYVDFSTLFKHKSNISISYILQLQCSALFALSQLMMLSVQFCEGNINLIISLMTSHKCQYIRKSCLFVISDLTLRYPNTMQPWIPFVFKILRDPSALVRKQALLVLSHLILIDAIKIHGFIAEIAYLIEDENSAIGEIAISFFASIAQDGNKLYNALSDIISHVIDQNNNKLEVNSIKSILRILFSFINKEKQVAKLVEKLINRINTTQNNQQRELIAYCISLLPHSERTLILLISQFSTIRSVIQNEKTRSHFLTISTGIHKHTQIFPEMVDLLSQFDNLLRNKEI